MYNFLNIHCNSIADGKHERLALKRMVESYLCCGSGQSTYLVTFSPGHAGQVQKWIYNTL